MDKYENFERISRVRKNQKSNTLGEEVKKIIESFTPSNQPKRLGLPVVGKTIYVNMDDILYCKADSNYTEVYLINDQKEMLSKKLKDLEELKKSILQKAFAGELTNQSAVGSNEFAVNIE